MKKVGLGLIVGAVVASGGIATVAMAKGGHPHSVASATSSATPRASSRTEPHAPGDYLPVKEPGEPCDMARHASWISALTTTIPIWAPEGEPLTDAWTCGGVPVLLFGGVQITYSDGFKKVDPTTKFPRMVASDGGRVETINGRPAYVHPADARGPRNGVWILVGDYSIGVTAKPDVGIDRVLEVAREIHIPSSVAD